MEVAETRDSNTETLRSRLQRVGTIWRHGQQKLIVVAPVRQVASHSGPASLSRAGQGNARCVDIRREPTGSAEMPEVLHQTI